MEAAASLGAFAESSVCADPRLTRRTVVVDVFECIHTERYLKGIIWGPGRGETHPEEEKRKDEYTADEDDEEC